MRYAFYAFCLLATIASILLGLHSPGWLWGAGAFGALAALGTWDLLQTRSTLRRNYPVIAHFRYWLESIGPEMRQYFIESDTAEVPFSREQRALVYQRAKSVSDVRPFGTLQDVYGPDYEWINHSLLPAPHGSHDFRVVGGRGNPAPILGERVQHLGDELRIAVGQRDPRAQSWREARGFYHDTGEGSISPYHREYGGDLVWEIGSGYFGCRNDDGSFNAERFAENAARPAGEDDRDQAFAGRQAGPWRCPACGQGHRRNLRHARRADGSGLRIAGTAQRVRLATGTAAIRGATARVVRRQAGRFQVRDRSSLGMVRHCQGHARKRPAA
jgi:hypothetical protein